MYGKRVERKLIEYLVKMKVLEIKLRTGFNTFFVFLEANSFFTEEEKVLFYLDCFSALLH